MGAVCVVCLCVLASVSNLSPGTTKEMVQTVFETHATLREVIMKEGFCFVNTSSEGDAAKAMAALQGASLNGSKISINFAKDRDRPAPSAPAFAQAPGSGPFGQVDPLFSVNERIV